MGARGEELVEAEEGTDDDEQVSGRLPSGRGSTPPAVQGPFLGCNTSGSLFGPAWVFLVRTYLFVSDVGLCSVG